MQLTADEVRRLVAQREGKSLEFKQGLPRDGKLARSLCAFANTRGGLLLIGVTDKGGFMGAPRPRATVSRLRSVAAERLEPPLEVQTGSLDVAGARIVWCSVPLSPARPHAVIGDDDRHEVVVRVGASNRVASGATLAGIRPRPVSRGGLDALERKVLAWVGQQTRGSRATADGATVAAFARAHNVGVQRARRAFTHLELAGRLVAHGTGARRSYGPA